MDCFALIADNDLYHPIRPAVFRCQRPQWNVAVWLLVIAVAWQAGRDGISHADDKTAGDKATEDDPASRQRASESFSAKLPAPPEAIAKLIADGKVVFDFYDGDRRNYAFAGETTFDFHYEYRCATRYRIIDQPTTDSSAARRSSSDSGPSSDSMSVSEGVTGKALEVTLDYEAVTLIISHRMRLPSRMVGEHFFDQPLVRHEFDHVAISSDQRLPSLLTKMLGDRNSKVIVALSEDEVESRDRAIYAKMARSAAREETAAVFDDFVSLVRIRYKELDRVTRHGIEPLAPETRLRLLSY